jgi:hypothetical protein
MKGSWKVADNKFTHTPVDSEGKRIAKENAVLRVILPEAGSESFSLKCKAHYDRKFPLDLRLDAGGCGKIFWFEIPATGEPGFITDEINTTLFDIDLPDDSVPVELELKVDAEKAEFFVNGTNYGHLAFYKKRPHRYFEIFAFGEAEVVLEEFNPGIVVSLADNVVRSGDTIVSTSIDMVMDMKRDELDWDMLDEYMAAIASRGIKKVNWIVQYCFPLEQQHKAIAAAHKAGMELYAIIKPFEFGSVLPFPFSKPVDNYAQRFGQVNKEVFSQRAPLDDSYAGDNDPVAKIRIVRDNDKEFDEKRLMVWVSDNGSTYSPYQGDYEITNSVEKVKPLDLWTGKLEDEVESRVIEITGLNISEKYFALSCNPRGSKNTFTNKIHRLLEVTSQGGKKVYFQYGFMLEPKAEEFEVAKGNKKGTLIVDLTASDNLPAEIIEQAEKDKSVLCPLNFMWDKTPYSISGSNAGCDHLEYNWRIDNDRNVIGMLREFNATTDRLFSPAVKKTRDFYVEMAEGWCCNGADGIDMRIRNHVRTLSLSDMHFNPEICAAYKEKYGEELTRSKTDREKHLSIIGGFYDQMLCEIRDAVHKHGKKLLHHINPQMDLPPGRQPLINIDFNWKKWLKEGIIDGFTLKEIWPEDPFYTEIMQEAEGKDLIITMSTYLLSVFENHSYPEIIKAFAETAHKHGIDVYDLYEASSWVQATAPGVVEPVRDKDFLPEWV